MTATPPVSVDRAFLRRLHQQDPKVELHWHAPTGRFVLFTRSRGRGDQADDVLTKELVFGEKGLPAVPGDWLIEWMKWADKYAGGAIDPQVAHKNYLDSLDEHERKRLEYWDKKQWNMSEDCAKHLKWCIDGRMSVTCDWGNPRWS